MKNLNSEISTWEYLASTLTQPHQESIKREILTKVRYLKQELIRVNCKHDPIHLKDYHDMGILCTNCHKVIFQSFDGAKLANKRKELGMS